jgi:hypothetical protein
MARGVDDLKFNTRQVDDVAFFHTRNGLRSGEGATGHKRQIADGVREQFCVELVDVNLYIGKPAVQSIDAGDMVNVTVSEY